MHRKLDIRRCAKYDKKYIRVYMCVCSGSGTIVHYHYYYDYFLSSFFFSFSTSTCLIIVERTSLRCEAFHHLAIVEHDRKQNCAIFPPQLVTAFTQAKDNDNHLVPIQLHSFLALEKREDPSLHYLYFVEYYNDYLGAFMLLLIR